MNAHKIVFAIGFVFILITSVILALDDGQDETALKGEWKWNRKTTAAFVASH